MAPAVGLEELPFREQRQEHEVHHRNSAEI